MARKLFIIFPVIMLKAIEVKFLVHFSLYVVYTILVIENDDSI